MKISAIELVNKYIEFKSWTKNLDKHHVITEDFEPAFYRYKQLKVLFELYRLNKIEDFEKGGFVLDKQIEDYAPFFEKVNQDVLALKGTESFLSADDKHLRAIARCFNRLLEYKILLYACKNYNAPILEASGLYRYSVYKTEQMNEELSSKSTIIDNILCAIISPENLQFDLQFLKENYEYPDIDLSEIDYAYNS